MRHDYWYYEPDEGYFMRRANMQLLWSIWPRRCYASKKWLCFCLAYRARRIITGPGEPVIEDRWFGQVEGLMQLIKVNS
jgi:hypothetical protein